MQKYTPERVAKVRKKLESTPVALKRDPSVNYYEGWFFVTLNTRDDVPILSNIAGKSDGQGDDAPHCVYTQVGKGVLEAWKRNEAIYPNVVVDMAEVMPEHFHGLIHLFPGNKKHLGHIIGGFMSGCSHAYWDTLGIDWNSDRYWENARASVWNDHDKDHTMSYRGPALFVHGYNDMEPITEQEVQIKREYIRDQARKRLLKGTRPACFRIIRGQHSANWTSEVVQQAISSDPFFARNRDKGIAAYMQVARRLNGGDTLCLDYLGNHKLLAAPRKLPLICHRADANHFEQQREAVLREARNGAVIVSAFISPKEREIRELLLTEMLPFIEVVDNGFADRYKPGGKAFYACAENRLVQITPWEYEYQKDTQVSREMCLVMNALARTICKTADDWWQRCQALSTNKKI